MSISIQRNRYVGRDYYVCLPTSYAQGNTRYPVVYVQDGDRLLPVLEYCLATGMAMILEDFMNISLWA